ncbi:MAG: carbonic anhydrase [Isosphaeraceae bacterium]|nr:carbonic anhydrase [Isosphaeraceae bacterium]
MPERAARRAAMAPIDFIYRYSPSAPATMYRAIDDPTLQPGEPEWHCVARKLIEGNLQVVRYIRDCREAALGNPTRHGSQVIQLSDSDVLLEPRDANGFPIQLPLALVLGCVDARAPAEIIFGMDFINDVFNVRLAGNVVAEECMGSIEYALRNLVHDAGSPIAWIRGEDGDPNYNKRMRLMISLGHEGCGAVSEAVRSFQASSSPKPVATGSVAALLGHLYFPALIMAAEALDEAMGQNLSREPEHFDDLARLVTYLNAAWGAHVMSERLRSVGGTASELVGVVYGVFDPRDMHVRAVPYCEGQPNLAASSFGRPPRDLEDLRAFARRLARASIDPKNADATYSLLDHVVIQAQLSE